MNYISVSKFAKRSGVSRQRVHVWLKEKRVQGVKKVDVGENVLYLIPDKAERPEVLPPGRPLTP